MRRLGKQWYGICGSLWRRSSTATADQFSRSFLTSQWALRLKQTGFKSTEKLLRSAFNFAFSSKLFESCTFWGLYSSGEVFCESSSKSQCRFHLCARTIGPWAVARTIDSIDKTPTVQTRAPGASSKPWLWWPGASVSCPSKACPLQATRALELAWNIGRKICAFIVECHTFSNLTLYVIILQNDVHSIHLNYVRFYVESKMTFHGTIWKMLNGPVRINIIIIDIFLSLYIFFHFYKVASLHIMKFPPVNWTVTLQMVEIMQF